MNDIRILECNRCFYRWSTRRLVDPKVCPGCNSPYWNKKRVRKWVTRYYGKKKVKIL